MKKNLAATEHFGVNAPTPGDIAPYQARYDEIETYLRGYFVEGTTSVWDRISVPSQRVLGAVKNGATLSDFRRVIPTRVAAGDFSGDNHEKDNLAFAIINGFYTHVPPGGKPATGVKPPETGPTTFPAKTLEEALAYAEHGIAITGTLAVEGGELARRQHEVENGVPAGSTFTRFELPAVHLLYFTNMVTSLFAPADAWHDGEGHPMTADEIFEQQTAVGKRGPSLG